MIISPCALARVLRFRYDLLLRSIAFGVASALGTSPISQYVFLSLAQPASCHLAGGSLLDVACCQRCGACIKNNIQVGCNLAASIRKKPEQLPHKSIKSILKSARWSTLAWIPARPPPAQDRRMQAIGSLG